MARLWIGLYSPATKDDRRLHHRHTGPGPLRSTMCEDDLFI